MPAQVTGRLAEHAPNNKAGEVANGLPFATRVARRGAIPYILGIMVRILPAFAALFAATSAILVPVAAEAAVRDIGVMPKGRYQCALPGDAAARPYVPVPELSFRISSASRYTHVSGKGIYLLEGNTLVFTRGPLKDMRLQRIQGGLLQQVRSDGTLGRVRCHRTTR